MMSVCAAVSLVVIAFMLSRYVTPEPIFEGRTLTELLTGKDYGRNQAQVSQAILASGDKAVPLLRRLLGSGNKIKRTILRRAPAWFWNRPPMRQWWHQLTCKERAMSTLEILGEAGRGATVDLLTIIQDSTESSGVRQHAMRVLLAVRAESSSVIPVLNKLAEDPVIGQSAAQCVRDFGIGKFLP